MSFENLSNAEIRDLVEKKTGKKPAPALSRAKMIDILEGGIDDDADQGDGAGDPGPDPLNDPLPPDPNADQGDGSQGRVEEPVVEDEGKLTLVKYSDDGEIIDKTVITKASWDLLPDHKYGWKIAPPKEAE